jgi:urease accessory protein
MLTLNTKVDHADVIGGELVLPYELREKSRLRAQLTSGEDVAVFTVRGTVLRNGDLLRGDDGRVVRIVAAKEATYRVECVTPRDLLRCAFHLGNRHTQAQVAGEAASGFLRIRKDPVLKDMLQGLGATVTEEEAPFEPESGAYGGGHHHHGDDHGHHLLAPVPLRQKIHRPSDKPDAGK